MFHQVRSWRLALAGLILFGSGAVWGARPAVAARHRNSGRATVRFYDGSATAATGDMAVWMATNSGKLYGAAGVQNGNVHGGRLYAVPHRGKVSGSLFDTHNKKAGAFNGAIDAGGGSGTYTLKSGDSGDWQVTAVVPDSGAVTSLAGTYSATEGSVDVRISLSEGGGYTATGDAAAGPFRQRVASVSGRWSADADGHLWVLVQKAKYNKLPGAPDATVPKQGVALKLPYTADGTTLTLFDPFQPAKTLYSLDRE